ncbi:MAG: hypothetical protein ABUL44_01095, partial [Flavobacterium sp.]
MKMKSVGLRKILLIAVFGIFPLFSFAQHARGGEILYRCVGGLTYEYSVTIWLDSITNSPLSNDLLFMDFGDGNQAAYSTIDAVSCVNLAGNLPANYNATNQLKWVFQHTYFGASGPAGYPQIGKFSYRTNGISNIPGSDTSYIFLIGAIFVDPNIGCNSAPNSPTSNYMFFPMMSQSNSYPLNYSDPDGDSLVYSLIPCNGFGYSFPDVLGGGTLSIDSHTGIISWNNPTQQGTYNVGVKIEQWKYLNSIPVLIGSHEQEIEFIVDP